MSCFLGLVTTSCPVDQNVPVLPILSEDFFFLEITMLLRQKVGNLRLISSEDLFFFFIEKTDKFFSFNKHPSLPLCKCGKPNYHYI